ncbi:MAG: YeeE/YedE family protein [Gammaproteobacteria bacterium]|nr:YeeE/YedE family protein [Gammaproteobacteria bacterium]
MSLVAPLAGGVLIGLSALAMLALLGRITGISGILAGVLNVETGLWRWAFLAGLIIAPPLFHAVSGQPVPAPADAGWPLIILAGLLVGFGTRHAGGCTSGHGVCGIGRLSPRSMAATATFIAAGMLTVSVMRHLVG